MEKKHQYQGLSEQQVEESRRQHGENILTPPEKASLWSQFLEKFEDPIIRILLVAWLLSMVIAGVHCWGPEAKGFTAFLEPIGIFFAIMLASCVSFFFEVKANKAFEILNTVNDDILVKVIRDGSIREVPRKEVVVGDIVVLETGEEVPADGHLLEAISLQINESTLTGEPIISKTTNEADFDPEATYPSNVVMRGTTVVDGHGVMEVEKVGDATGYGKVYEGSQIDNNIDTPLQIQLKGLAGVISKAGYTIAGVTFVALTLKYVLSDSFAGTPVMDIIAQLLNFFMVAVTLIVVSVPEGLPMSVTLSLAINMNRMLKTNNLVRKMHACETMGATTVICTDKTGTLTQNQMQVYQTRFYNLKDQTLGGDEMSDLIREGISTNSTAFLERAEGKVKALGNPTEAALLLWLDSQHQNYLELRENAPVVEQLTFSTERKYMATIVRSSLLGKKVLYVKGAPEIVLANSARVAMDGTYKPVEACKAEIERQLLDYQNQAMRTLGFAYQIGGWVYDSLYSGFMSAGRTGTNWHTDIYDRWTPDNRNTDVPRLSMEDLQQGMNGDRSLTKASYLSLRNATLGYTFPKRMLSKAKIEKLRLYVVGDNLFLLSARKGLDPRQSITGDTDYNYSAVRTVSFGINLEF